jgi:hypothetical protein
MSESLGFLKIFYRVTNFDPKQVWYDNYLKTQTWIVTRELIMLGLLNLL